jgi:5-methylcytosine-specific restriction endonuclease McrA
MFAAGINPFTKEIELVSGKSKRVIKENHSIHIRTKRGKFTWEKTEVELRKDYRYKIWRKSVLERDKKCMSCNATKKLVAHHKQKLSEHPELAFDVDNGLTLCPTCHIQTNFNREKYKIKYAQLYEL